MTTAAQVIAVARGQVGYHESGNNWTKFWAELDSGLQGSAWCAAFASWCFIHAGSPLPAIDRSYGYISAYDAMVWAQAHGYWDTSGHYAPADLLILNGGEHTAIIVSDNGAVVQSIDGNWGDQVMVVNRSHGVEISGAVKASRLLTGGGGGGGGGGGTSPNPALVRGVQNAVHITADGRWGDITSHAASVVIDRDVVAGIKYLQTRVGAVADGIWGPASQAAWIAAIKAIQTAIGTAADGVWGNDSKAKWAIAYRANYRKY
jgi:hypothetical protein